MKRWLASVCLLFACLAPAALGLSSTPAQEPSPAAATVTVHFSPRGGCTEEIVARCGEAKKTILVQAYQFTSQPIADALVAAEKRGVEVTIIADRTQRRDKDSKLPQCRRAGATCFLDEKHAIQHNKVMVIDDEVVLTGSFNFSGSAETRNSENLVTLRSPELARLFREDFARHLAHSTPYKVTR